MIEIITATRLTEQEFWNKSALGISLKRLNFGNFMLCAAFENSIGLPKIYNEFIHRSEDDNIIVFIHDDVWIDDYFFVNRIIEGLTVYDVIGIAGNRRRIPFQASWGFLDINASQWDQENLSGAIAHGKQSFGNVMLFGDTPAECELLDGVFIAAKRKILINNNVSFDPLFDFHFYDMDFCRSARQKGLHIGTWPICLTHQSHALFGTQQWRDMYDMYIKKWKL